MMARIENLIYAGCFMPTLFENQRAAEYGQLRQIR